MTTNDELKYRDCTNARYFRDGGETNNQPSMTIPDQTMSLKEILDRFARGLPANVNTRIPVYDPENTLPEMHTLDFADQRSLIESVKTELEQLSLPLPPDPDKPNSQNPDNGSAGAVKPPKPEKQDGEARPGASPAGGATNAGQDSL